MKALEIKDKIQYGLAAAYLVSGEDSVLKDYVIRTICATLPKDEQDFSITTLEGNVAVNEIINTAQMVSFFADSKRILIVKNYVKTLKGDDEEKLLSYMEDPNDDCTIIFEDCGNTFKSIADYCVPVDCNRASVYELENFVRKIIKAKGYSDDRGALNELVNMCNSDMGKVIQEANKLMAYKLDDRIITIQDVKDIVCMNTENKVYELSNAIQEGKKDLAIELLDTMLKRGEKASALLAMIASSFRKTFWIANTNSSDEEMCKVLGMTSKALNVNKKNIAKNKTRIRGYIPYLKKIIDMLNDLEYKFKSGVLSQEAALKLAMAHLLG